MPINGNSLTLTSAILSDKISLKPQLPAIPYGPVPAFDAPAIAFDILFEETSNSGTPSDCAVATSPVVCNDIFVISGAGLVFDAGSGSLNQQFDYFGNIYNARIIIDSLSLLSDDACIAAGAALGCYGLTTVENQTNTFQVSLEIESVPEPHVIVLMGLGLVYLGGANLKVRSEG